MLKIHFLFHRSISVLLTLDGEISVEQLKKQIVEETPTHQITYTQIIFITEFRSPSNTKFLYFRAAHKKAKLAEQETPKMITIIEANQTRIL